MANEEHLAILNQGVEAWNRWRRKAEAIEKSQRADLGHVNLSNTNLVGANLRGAQLHLANLAGADLSEADLVGAQLSLANLNETNLSSANFMRTILSSAYLSGANLRGAILQRVDMTFANFDNANLSGATLLGSDVFCANFAGANLTEAKLGGVDFSVANLCEANLSDADLRNAIFSRTHLRGTIFDRSHAGGTLFGDCDLSEASGLCLIQHDGPSIVSLDAIYASGGKIPESFLRGCGVPESFITQIHSLVNAEDGIQFYSCFISYSSTDEEFARRLHGRMRDAHLRVWFAPEDMKSGQKLHEQIETAIRVYDKLLIVLSEASLQSEWVMTELRKARKAERQSGQRKLFPVRLVEFETLRDWECFDADSGKDLAVELREYFIPDFSDWKEHDQFEAAFARLLKDLKSEEKAIR
jgi:uncharacterized protein YjbI with pentapeptide repeats